MGALHQGPPLLQDLKVTILSSSKVYPPESLEKRSMFLSNIDQVLNFNVETVHFFTASPRFPPEAVEKKLRSALERLLVPYDFLAGRLRFSPQEGRLEIECGAEGGGAGFVTASCELTLDELGEVEYPNPAFRQLAMADPPEALCTFQVTSFKCGGFTLGISTNHCTFDGISFRTFLKNLTSLLADKPLAVPPCNDRCLLAARSPPHVEFPHPELMKIDADVPLPTSTMLDAPVGHKLEFKLFRLSPDDISSLKSKAKNNITSFNVVTAHLWRCKALSNYDGDPNKTSTILFAVDLRPRLNPPLPQSYTGNAVLSAAGTMTLRELENGPFSSVVDAVRACAQRMDDGYAQSLIDWGQLHRGFPRGDLFVSSWWRLGFAEVEYPWGRPMYSCPVVHPSRDIVLLLPTIDNKGVNAMVALPHEEMERFSAHFYEFLA